MISSVLPLLLGRSFRVPFAPSPCCSCELFPPGLTRPEELDKPAGLHPRLCVGVFYCVRTRVW